MVQRQSTTHGLVSTWSTSAPGKMTTIRPGFCKKITTSILSTEARDDLTIKYGFDIESMEDRPLDIFLVPVIRLGFWWHLWAARHTDTSQFSDHTHGGHRPHDNEINFPTAAGGYGVTVGKLENQRGWSGNIGLNIHPGNAWPPEDWSRCLW